MANRLGPPHPEPAGPRVYERHDPEALALHRVVQENLATFYAAIEEGWQTGLPEFVRAEFAGFLDCSVMQGGFAHLACEDCGYLVWSPLPAVAVDFVPRALAGA